MGWTSPRTWVAGETVTAAIMNTHVRDNLSYLAAPPVFVGEQLTLQSIPNNTLTAITFDTEVIDTENGHSTSTNPSRYTVTIPGYFDVDALVLYNNNGTGARRAAIAVNGTEIIEANYMTVTGVVSTSAATVATIVGPLNIGDYIETFALQNSGGALNTFAGSVGSRMSVHLARLT